MTSNFLSYLLTLETKGIKLGLDRTRQILKACDNPHKKIKTIQIVGTNGKGSTSAMIANILKVSGYTVGLYTSPHLNTINERIRINGQAIPNNQIIKFIDQYKSHIDKLQISFFEAMTALALWHFNNAKVDIAVLETGLGGRLDSVSICSPELLVFTQISLDHQHILGSTIEKITAEKAGAIKKNSHCISSTQKQNVKYILNQKVQELNGTIEYIKPPKNTKIYLNGAHQSINQALAIKAVQSINHFHIQDKDIKLGLESIKWPGRIQQIHNQPTIFFDVAHNSDSFLSLCHFITTLQIKGNKILILALQQNKNIQSAIKFIEQTFDKIIITQTNIRNSLKADQLKQFFTKHQIHIIPDPRDAINTASIQHIDDCIVIAGSHYLGPYITQKFKISFENI